MFRNQVLGVVWLIMVPYAHEVGKQGMLMRVCIRCSMTRTSPHGVHKGACSKWSMQWRQ
jgi:hypothetical protein